MQTEWINIIFEVLMEAIYICRNMCKRSVERHDLQSINLRRSRHLLDVVLQRRTSRLQRAHKRLGHDLRARGTRVGVVVRKQRVNSTGTHALVHAGDGGAVQHLDGADRLARVQIVCLEAAGAVDEAAGLPGVVGGGGGDDDGGALGLEELGGVDEIGLEGEHGLGGAVVRGLAGGGVVVVDRVAVGAAVVGRGQATAVVVPEFDDHVVALFHVGRHGREAPFACEGARRAAGDGVVHHGDLEERAQVVTPALGGGGVRAVAASGHSGIPG